MPSGDAHRSLARALDILELCSLNGSGYTLTQLSQQLGIAKGSISPLLHTLLARGYLTLDDQDHHYRIGRMAFRIGNTYLEEAGNGLSGGEKQRIALARAFLKDSNLYILDESTSNLDFATETLIFNMIYEQLADRSMLIVAHRLSTIRDCDLILVMDHGKIVERGNHEELMAKNGRYAELWNMQQGIFRSLCPDAA